MFAPWSVSHQPGVQAAASRRLTVAENRSTVDIVPPSAHLVNALRLLLVLTFAALLMAQLRALPAIYDDWLRDSPSIASAASLVLPGGMLVLLCAQAVVVCTWRLLALVEHDQVFSERAFAWVDAILTAVVTGSVLLLAMIARLVHLGGPVQLAVALLLLLVAGAAGGLLMVVVRGLLRQATALRTDLDAVI